LEIYLDNAATTKPIMKDSIKKHLKDAWYNPSSAYGPAAEVSRGINKARDLLKSLTGFSGDCIFTSGGTEANNAAVMSVYRPGAHYITSAVEHPSVYNAFKHLETLGASVDYIKPKDFCISEEAAAAVRENTVLVSVMHVNNETGALNDINSIARAVKAKNPDALFHSDGVQALYKTNIYLTADIDYYTLSAHKIHALKGTGAILAGENSRLKKLVHGGEQEFALRPGTENTLGIQAFSEALELGKDGLAESPKKIKTLEQDLLNMLSDIEDASINLPYKKVPHIVNVSFPGVRAEVLVRALGERGIYIGTGAACSRGKVSRVLLESGVDRESAEGAVRISMSRFTTRQDIEICAEELRSAVLKLRKFSRK
jgi:cysteine desulfurase